MDPKAASDYRKPRIASCACVLLGVVWAALALAALLPAASNAETRAYFGNLHAHSQLSDGHADISPRQAFDLAKGEGKLDFLCLSEHNHMLEPTEFATLMSAATAATKDGFVALFGQEFSTITKGFNHTNIHNYPNVIGAEYNGRYRDVFQDVLGSYRSAHPESTIVAAFNHPKSIETDYGLKKDFGGDWSAFVQTLDPIVQLIAIGNGPADAASKSFVPGPGGRFLHRDVSITTWFSYLARGMHLAPQIDHDTHSATYGFRVDGRTAVWVDGALTKEGLLKALMARHCYATEDRNLTILPKVTGSRLPGDILPIQGDGVLQLDLSITDPDEPAAAYQLEVWSGVAGSGTAPRRQSGLSQRRDGDGPLTLTLPASEPAYFVIHVRQESATGPCGKSDDAYLAPIWISEVAGDDHIEDAYAFVGSKNSSVYHYPDCRDVARIAAHNLRYYDAAPEGKRLHQGCPR